MGLPMADVDNVWRMLSWDEACVLWDNELLTTDQLVEIATLLFDAATLPAVLAEIKTLESLYIEESVLMECAGVH